MLKKTSLVKTIGKISVISLLCVGLAGCLIKIDPNGVSTNTANLSKDNFSVSSKGHITGYQHESYFFALKQGDKLQFNLASKPTQRVEAWVYNNPTGSLQLTDLDNSFTANASMLYEIRLSQPRTFARRNLTADYSFTAEIISTK